MNLLGFVQVLVDEHFCFIVPFLRVLHVVRRGKPEADVDAHGLVNHLEVGASFDLLGNVSRVVKCSIGDLTHAVEAVLLKREEELDTIGTATAEDGLVTNVVLGCGVIVEQVRSARHERTLQNTIVSVRQKSTALLRDSPALVRIEGNRVSEFDAIE